MPPMTSNFSSNWPSGLFTETGLALEKRPMAKNKRIKESFFISISFDVGHKDRKNMKNRLG